MSDLDNLPIATEEQRDTVADEAIRYAPGSPRERAEFDRQVQEEEAERQAGRPHPGSLG